MAREPINKPGFLCIGAQKAGTSWLFRVLREHPDVWLGPFKEYQFFNSLFCIRDTNWTQGHVLKAVERALRSHVEGGKSAKVDLTYVSYLSGIADPDAMFTEDWYRRIFSRGGNALKGDISPAYSSLPPEGIDYVLRFLGSVPIVYLVRDPLQRALSQLRMVLSRQGISEPADGVDWERFALDPNIRDRGDYQRNITNWVSRYPRESILFVPYQDIAAQPISVLRQIEQHIGVGELPNYESASQRVFEGEKIEIPEHATGLLREVVAPQYDFLKSTFDKEFVARL
jgi:hypothetical protein